MSGGAEDNLYTYDLAVPRRPDIADLGGADIEDGSPAPTKGAQWYGGQANEHGRNLAGLNRLNPTCRVWVEFDGTDFVVSAIDSMGTEDKLTAADFTPTSGSTGTCDIAWTAGALPPMARAPHAWLTGSFGSAYASIATANGIQVRLRDTAALANLNFAVDIF